MTNIAETALKALKEAVKEALEKRAKLGLPSVFMKDGKLCYLMPNGTYTFKEPKRRIKHGHTKNSIREF